MNLSIRTVEAYRDKLFEKTATQNAAELIMFAARNGINVNQETNALFYCE